MKLNWKNLNKQVDLILCKEGESPHAHCITSTDSHTRC